MLTAIPHDPRHPHPGARRLQRLGSLALLLPCLAFAPAVPDGAAEDDTAPADKAEDEPDALPDDAVATALERELLAAKHVPGHALDVTVARGIVTLEGQVSNILARERAVRIAKMVKGVRAVVDRIDVRASGLDDETIARDIRAALITDPATDSWELDVTVEDGVVTLRGPVGSRAESDLAETVVKGVRGVRSVRNDVLVTHANDRLDSEIAAEVEQLLAWDARLDDHRLTVEVQDGVVHLSGVVGSVQEKFLARSQAWVSGVTDVESDAVTVAWWVRDPMLREERWHAVGDDSIRNAVVAALIHDPRVSSFDPQVSVERGVVTLRGAVDNLKARRAAAQDARNTVGVWRVENLLRVKPSGVTADADIGDRIRAALVRDPFVNATHVIVSVDAGVARLDGEVASYFEREQAEDLCARIQGVTEIDNGLTIDYELPRAAIIERDWGPTRFDHDFDYHTVVTRSDAEIQAAVVAELFWSPFVDESRIDVHVDDGVVHLGGEVDTWRERRIATENALEGGATKVVNDLEVALTPYHSDGGTS